MNEATLQERVACLETNDKQRCLDIIDIKTDIRDIKDNLLRRPSWAVSVVITVLSTICVGLIVFIATIQI